MQLEEAYQIAVSVSKKLEKALPRPFPDPKEAVYLSQHLTGVKGSPLPRIVGLKKKLTDGTSFSGDSAGESRGLTNIWGYEELYAIDESGNVWNKKRKYWLGQHDTGKGYLKVELWRDGTRTNCKVHRLVALTFIDNIDFKQQVNHIDGNKKNNHVSNLEWCTAEENMNHAVRTGLLKRKQKCTQ